MNKTGNFLSHSTFLMGMESENMFFKNQNKISSICPLLACKHSSRKIELSFNFASDIFFCMEFLDLFLAIRSVGLL